MTVDHIFQVAGAAVVISPAVLLAVLGIFALAGRPLSERTTSRLTQVAVLSGLAASLCVLVTMLVTGLRQVPLTVGDWVVIPEEGFHFQFKVVFDRLSIPFVILTYVLVGAIGAFTSRYLHREPGYQRFFLLYAVFLTGMVVSTLAGTIEMLFFGWEFVGLSSALLVAFFHERPRPVVNGHRVWSVYRLTDAAFLIAAITFHHSTGGGDFSGMAGAGPWPDNVINMSGTHATIVGLLLLVAIAGKSALVPFSNWLPRAMEGPTPSSAVFYGALSVHLGTVLLLRISPVIDRSPTLAVIVIVLGCATAIFASISASVQTDIKSALALSSLTQVGIITAEIGFGLRYVALGHIIGHASLRALQLLRAPNLIHEYHTMENAIGEHLMHPPGAWERRLPEGVRRWLYAFALDRGALDAVARRLITTPFLRVMQSCERLERRWVSALRGSGASRQDGVISDGDAE